MFQLVAVKNGLLGDNVFQQRSECGNIPLAVA